MLDLHSVLCGASWRIEQLGDAVAGWEIFGRQFMRAVEESGTRSRDRMRAADDMDGVGGFSQYSEDWRDYVDWDLRRLYDVVEMSMAEGQAPGYRSYYEVDEDGTT